MRKVTSAEFDAIEQQVRERKSVDCLCVTTWINPRDDERPAQIISYLHALDLSAEDLAALRQPRDLGWLEGWLRIRSALVDGVHIVDEISPPEGAPILTEQRAALERIRLSQ